MNPRFPPPDVSHVFPEFPAPDLGSVLLQESITLHDVKALQLVYRRHCEVTVPPPPRTGDRRPGPRGGPPRMWAESRACLPQVRRSASHVARTAQLSRHQVSLGDPEETGVPRLLWLRSR